MPYFYDKPYEQMNQLKLCFEISCLIEEVTSVLDLAKETQVPAHLQGAGSMLRQLITLNAPKDQTEHLIRRYNEIGNGIIQFR
jgi:hypothetical protein